jgi:DNA helicase-2/ATP-dependent DNA helicase PcrA
MKQLSLTAAKQRMLRGETQYNKPSRFIHEIPRYLLKMAAAAPRKVTFKDAEYSSDSKRGFGQGNSYDDGFSQEINFDKPEPGTYKQNQASYKPFLTPETKQFEGSKMGTLDYGVGDTVKHIKFGVGIVTDITKGGKDYEVTVDFPNFGIKKLLSSFANLIKID